jgi:cysteine desulfurase
VDAIYLDNNSTTPMLPAVWEAMQPALTEVHGNPASAHSFGRRARQLLEDAREQCAALLGAHPDEFIFTSGGTEANNLAIFGLAGPAPGHLIVSPVEHPSVIEPVRRLEGLGHTLEFLSVRSEGAVDPLEVSQLLNQQTRLVAAMLANHETGAIQPIREVAEAAGAVSVHCDAVQAVGKIPVNFHELGVTTMSLSAHKFHGPKGIGAMLLRRHAKVEPRAYGGHQQRGFRPGTEPVALAVGMAKTLELAMTERDDRSHRVVRLRSLFLAKLRAEADPVIINGPQAGGVPHTLNISFPGCRADSLLMNFDLAGIACSTGSACSSGSLLPSPVLKAMGIEDDRLLSAMRFSFSALLSEEEVLEAARRIATVVRRLRTMRETTPTPGAANRAVPTG